MLADIRQSRCSKNSGSYWRSKSLRVSQYVRLAISVSIWYLSPEGFAKSRWSSRWKKQVLRSVKGCSRNRLDGLASKIEGVHTKSRVSFLTSLLSGLPEEDIAHLGGLPPNNQTKEIPLGNASPFQLILEPIKSTTKIHPHHLLFYLHLYSDSQRGHCHDLYAARDKSKHQ